MQIATAPRIVLVGEAMLELSSAGDTWRLSYGGDTLNTAIHLARASHDVAYLTAIGGDPLSADLLAKWGAEGVDTSLVLTHPNRATGLYAISTDARGERSFAYWRDTSAAREMFSLPDWEVAVERGSSADLLAFSLVSLAILPNAAREILIALAATVRANGGQVAFDGNYRPLLWADLVEARAWRDRAIAQADIGLPTLEDERLLSNIRSASAVASHWRSLGCGEVVVKLGAEGCLLPDGNILPPPERLDPVDTSGAGDAFNAGYLSARMRGAVPSDAAREGHLLAGWTVLRRGAIPPRED